MVQLTRLPFELTRDFSILVYSACPGTSNFVRFSAIFELNHSRINAIHCISFFVVYLGSIGLAIAALPDPLLRLCTHMYVTHGIAYTHTQNN